jgi:hypothetical protein
VNSVLAPAGSGARTVLADDQQWARELETQMMGCIP